MTISEEISKLSNSLSDIKTEIRNKGQTVSTVDPLVSLPSKIDNISNIKGEDYSKTPLKDIIEGTIEYLYDTTLEYIRPYCFDGCKNFKKARFTNLLKICPHSFDGCFNFNTLILDSSFVILENINAFKDTKFFKGEGIIYVPTNLVSTYKSDSIWTYFNSYIQAIPN